MYNIYITSHDCYFNLKILVKYSSLSHIHSKKHTMDKLKKLLAAFHGAMEPMQRPCLGAPWKHCNMTLSRREDPKKVVATAKTVGGSFQVSMDVGSYPGLRVMFFCLISSSNVDPGLINPMVV